MAIHAGESSTAQCISTVSSLRKRRTATDSGGVCNSLTQATDTTNVRLVFAAVKETILQNALKDSGIL